MFFSCCDLGDGTGLHLLKFYYGFGMSYFEFQERNLLKMKLSLVRFISTQANDFLLASLNSNLKVVKTPLSYESSSGTNQSSKHLLVALCIISHYRSSLHNNS